MKCPNCKLVCSDAAERCPKCKHDLTPLKINIGLGQGPRVSVKAKKVTEPSPQPQQPAQISRPKLPPIVDPNWRAPLMAKRSEILAAENIEMLRWFKDSEAEIPSAEDEVSLGAEQLLSVHNRDDIRVVFDVADEAFENSDIERLLEAGVSGSDVVRADSVELASALKKAQREMDAPFTLAAMSRARQSGDGQDSALFRKTRRVVPASRARIAAAGGVDQLAVCGCAVLIVTLLWPEIMADLSSPPDYILIALLTSTIFFVVLLQAIYWVCCYSIAGKTVGEWAADLRVVTQRGSPPSKTALVLRAAIAPVGRFFQVFGGPAPHCYITDTILTRSRKLGRAGSS